MPGLFEWSLLVALPLAFLVAGTIRGGIERGVIRYVYGRPLETLLAIWGLSLILQQTDGQRIAASLETVVGGTIALAMETRIEAIGTATALADLCSMRHETQDTRLFRS